MKAKTFRVLVTGSRTWQARRLIFATLGVYLEQYGASLVVCKSGQPPDRDICMNFGTFRELAMQVYLETDEQLDISR